MANTRKRKRAPTKKRKSNRTRKSSKKSGSSWVSAIALLIVGSAVAAVAWLMIVFPSQRASLLPNELNYTLSPQANIDQVAQDLFEEGVVEHPRVFAAYVKMLGGDKRLRVGNIYLRTDLTMHQVVRHIAKGFGVGRVRVTIPEGFNRFDIAKRLAKYRVCGEQEFLEAVSSPKVLSDESMPHPSLEGYLFPDTYVFLEDTSASQVVRTLVQNWRKRVLPLLDKHAKGMSGLQRELTFDIHDVLILASVVEKEAAKAHERPIIAGVFLNRLRSPSFRPKHRLQADPTVSYGCLVEPEQAKSCKGFKRKITKAMLGDATNRYNSYRHPGLPPGPISNPGLSSIEAVLNATQHEYLYFVARGKGRHEFSKQLKKHNAAVDKFMRSPKK